MKSKILFLIGLFILCFSSGAQVLDTTAVRFMRYHAQNPQEKAYLRTDKEVYTRGETIWFSAYLLNAATNRPTVLSNLLYVELINDSDSILTTYNIKIEEGVGRGDIRLVDSLSEGIYRLRAYSNYMRNFDESFIFSKPIKILDFSRDTRTSENKPELRQIDIRFFPEGGDLVSGQINYVAFKATNESGYGVPVNGTIVDETGEELLTFDSEIKGMGKFLLNPVAGKKYFAKYTVSDVEFSRDLPVVRESGYVLNGRQTEDKTFLTVKPAGDLSMEGSFLVGHASGDLFLALPTPEGQPYLYAPLPADQMPNGILHFTFFDAEGVPRAERLIYNENSTIGNELSIDGPEKADTREKISFELELMDLADTALNGKASVSILSDELHGPNKVNIRNYIGLSSELKGRVENPEMLFDPEYEDRFKHRDLIMATNGWRRFAWEDVLQEKYPDIEHYPEKGFSLEGRVVRYNNRDRGTRAKLTLSFLENLSYKSMAISDEDGTFWFDGLGVEDTVNARLESVRVKVDGEDVKEINGGTYIQMKEKSVPQRVFKFFDAFEQDQALEGYVDNSMKIRNIEAEFGNDVIILDEMQVEAREDRRNQPFYRENMLYQQPDTRVVMENFANANAFQNIFDFMRGRVPGVTISGTFPDQTATVRGLGQGTQQEALFLLDGAITDATVIQNIQPSQVEFIDVLKGGRAAAYGAQANGVIAIYRYQGPRGDSDVDPVGEATFRMLGYYPPREFYVPNYDEMTDEEKVKPDYRNTLYWNPNIVIQDGKAEFEFFTSDDQGPFTLYFEGLDESGRVFTKTASLNVD